MKTTWAFSISLCLLAGGCATDSHWDYTENGPTHWGEFSRTCAKGHAQSPINILPGKTVSLNPEYILHLDEDIHTTAKVIDNGHSIKVTPKAGAKILLHGEEFILQQFHFHGKSEHTVNGKRYDLVAHFVHQNPKTKQLAVVAVFFEEGDNNPVLDNILGNIGEEIRIDPQDLLPKDLSHYYHYIGSLTTPPCSENVQWFLLKQPDQASRDQIQDFRKYYVDNERPIQELFDRQVETN
ncbi:TPA: carbonic anhydrase family protein [Candidatus Micrarchaeota archaeon]|nr:carbonic anhydrase family protein [Candidatus Micrarchaeota archaeon]